MPKRIVLIQGHPDPHGAHFGHALLDYYAGGAAAGGHQVRRVTIAALDFPLLRSKEEWETGMLPANLREAQLAIAWADHLVLAFPLWLGTMPAGVKAFLEQVLRPGFAFRYRKRRLPIKCLTGKSARLVVTMGMPAIWYRWYYRAHGVRGLERNILGFCGVAPIRETFIGLVEEKSEAARQKLLVKMTTLGRTAR